MNSARACCTAGALPKWSLGAQLLRPPWLLVFAGGVERKGWGGILGGSTRGEYVNSWLRGGLVRRGGVDVGHVAVGVGAHAGVGVCAHGAVGVIARAAAHAGAEARRGGAAGGFGSHFV